MRPFARLQSFSSKPSASRCSFSFYHTPYEQAQGVGRLDWLLRSLKTAPLNAFPGVPLVGVYKVSHKVPFASESFCFPCLAFVQARAGIKNKSPRFFNRRLCAQLCRDDWIRSAEPKAQTRRITKKIRAKPATQSIRQPPNKEYQLAQLSM